MRNIYQQIIDQQSVIEPMVLATVTRTSGSTPQKPGSSALFSKSGLICGTVGGGIVEAKVAKIAADSIISKESGLYHFNLANDISDTEEAICGGKISVLVDAGLNDHIKVFKQIKQSIYDHVPGVLITTVTDVKGHNMIINRYWMSHNDKPPIHDEYIKKIEPLVTDIISSGKSTDFREMELINPVDKRSAQFFLEPVFPPSRLVIAGAGHIGKALSHLGRMLDFEVTVIDERPEYANPVNLPDADHIIVQDIGTTMNELKKDQNTYVVIVTRGHNDDAAALKPCIGTNLAYTGMIGSNKKIGTMRMSFVEKGWATVEQWDKIYAPVGLNIKSQSVEEIAVSIAAQLVLVRNSMMLTAGGSL